MKTLLLLMPLLIVACSPKATAPSLPASTPEPVPVAISLMQVVEAFDKSQLPMTKATIYDETTDPNGLLGRPNRYVEKMNFFDERDKIRKHECSIEIFRNAEDAKARHDYLVTIGKASSLFATYPYLHKNVLVRISFGVLPKDADVYRLALSDL